MNNIIPVSIALFLFIKFMKYDLIPWKYLSVCKSLSGVIKNSFHLQTINWSLSSEKRRNIFWKKIGNSGHSVAFKAKKDSLFITFSRPLLKRAIQFDKMGHCNRAIALPNSFGKIQWFHKICSSKKVKKNERQNCQLC